MVGSETLTRVRQARGKHRDPSGSPDELAIVGCVVWPRDANASGSEKTSGQDTVIVGYSALLPPGSDVVATDKLRWRGLDFDVIGEPATYMTPFTGTDPGLLVSIGRVTG